jgi:hypothetical protein
LQTGFDAFKAMGAAGEFLETIRRRETALMVSLFERGEVCIPTVVDLD